MKKLVIIPAYNEEKSIVKVVNNIKKYAPDFDYVVINDGSLDSTLDVCYKNKINVVNLPVNLGIGGAMQTGYKYAYNYDYDIAVQIDGDGQHDPQYLNYIASFIESGQVDMVIGSRFIDKQGFQSSFMRRIGIRYFQMLLKFCTGFNITDATSGFRACNRDIIKYFSQNYPKDYPEPESIVMISRERLRIKEIPVVMKERATGVSSINAIKSIYYMIKVTLSILISRIKPRKTEEDWEEVYNES
ncbi:glycosyltransferase family 2 protein [Clostridiaceae bacterium 35-E11]